MVKGETFMFHVRIPCDKTFSLVPSARSSVKVKAKYLGRVLEKKIVAGGIGVSQTHLVLKSQVGGIYPGVVYKGGDWLSSF